MPNPGIIALAVILGVIVCAFVGYAAHRWWVSRREEFMVKSNPLLEAILLSQKIDDHQKLMTEMRWAVRDADPDAPPSAAYEYNLYRKSADEMMKLRKELFALMK